MWLRRVTLFGILAALTAAQAAQQAQQAPVNPAIDMEGFLRVSARAAKHRESQEEFARMSREPETIILDARSKDKYDQLHVYGYRNVYELRDTLDINESKLEFEPVVKKP
jgi:hypothetical protein